MTPNEIGTVQQLDSYEKAKLEMDLHKNKNCSWSVIRLLPCSSSKLDAFMPNTELMNDSGKKTVDTMDQSCSWIIRSLPKRWMGVHTDSNNCEKHDRSPTIDTLISTFQRILRFNNTSLLLF